MDFVLRAYKNTSAGSLLAKYCLKSMFFVMDEVAEDDRWSAQKVAQLFQELPSFASEYLFEQRNRPVNFQSVDPRQDPPCHFHKHGSDESCTGNYSRKRKLLHGEVSEAEISDEFRRLGRRAISSVPHPQDFDFDMFVL